MDFTHWWPLESIPLTPPPPPQHPAIHYPYSPHPCPPLRPPLPTHYSNPNPNPYAPHAGYAAGLAAGAGENVGAGRAYYYERIGPDPVGYGPIPPRPGSDLAAPSHAAPPHKGSKSNNKKGSKPTKVVQSAYCGVCKVECTTQEVLNAHKLGKKHKKKLQQLQESITPKSHKSPVTTDLKEKKEQKKRKNAPREDLETKKRKILEGGVQPNEVKVCIICNVVVNSQKVFDSHIAGSKHADNVRKQQEAATAS